MKIKEFLEHSKRKYHSIAIEFDYYTPKYERYKGHELAFDLLLKKLPEYILETEIE